MSLDELKTKMTEELKTLGISLDQHNKMQVAINLKISLATVVRYTGGEKGEVRNLELGEKILNEGKNILVNKTATA